MKAFARGLQPPICLGQTEVRSAEVTDQFVAALQRAQHAVPLRSIGEIDMEGRAEGTCGRRAVSAKAKRADGTPALRKPKAAFAET
jgi:hypothetical protein